MKRYIILTLMLVGAMLLLTACVPGSGRYTTDNPAGFFCGIWHGWIAPLSLIMSLFSNAGYRIWEVYNTGFAYDLGFTIAIGSSIGFPISFKFFDFPINWFVQRKMRENACHHVNEKSRVCVNDQISAVSQTNNDECDPS